MDIIIESTRFVGNYIDDENQEFKFEYNASFESGEKTSYSLTWVGNEPADRYDVEEEILGMFVDQEN